MVDFYVLQCIVRGLQIVYATTQNGFAPSPADGRVNTFDTEDDARTFGQGLLDAGTISQFAVVKWTKAA